MAKDTACTCIKFNLNRTPYWDISAIHDRIWGRNLPLTIYYSDYFIECCKWGRFDFFLPVFTISISCNYFAMLRSYTQMMNRIITKNEIQKMLNRCQTINLNQISSARLEGTWNMFLLQTFITIIYIYHRLIEYCNKNACFTICAWHHWAS